MNFNHLEDIEFLTALDKLKVKTQYIRIQVLNFNEEPIRNIQGRISSGSVNVNGAAGIRRTINLTMVAEEDSNELENIDNLISINKKIKVFVGYKNPFKSYQQYGDIVWFKCGTYVISSASINRNATAATIQISGKDKMVTLNGECGGTLIASTVFHEIEKVSGEGDNEVINYEPIPIVTIIRNAVNKLGGVPEHQIYINDLEETAKILVKYIGDNNIYFYNKYQSFLIGKKPTGVADKDIDTRRYGQDVGYKDTEFTYPGELIFAAGETVYALLDKICKALGNFEFFFDLDGNFIFQEIRNYVNTTLASKTLKDLVASDYSYNFKIADTKYKYAFISGEDVISYAVSPKYDNIKNSFVVWGKNDADADIRYHLVIDKKPQITRAGVTEWREQLYLDAKDKVDSNSDTYGEPISLLEQELLTEWRKLYDPIIWENTGGWNPDIEDNPAMLHYWLDYIDADSILSKYSVNMIGERSKVVNEDTIKTIFNIEVPKVVFLSSEEATSDKIQEITTRGDNICILSETAQDYFVNSSTGTSCFDRIRELLYQHVMYNSQVQITCVPKYYLEPNNVIYIKDKETGIDGNYVISQFTLPLNYNGTMSITAMETINRDY